MTERELNPGRWQELSDWGNEFTCYSAAVATWSATANQDWGSAINPGLWLSITEAGEGLLGFAYFPPGLRADLGLRRAGADEAESAVEGVRAELERSGRVIVAGDGFHLPWHVAHGRAHAPHWFVLMSGTDGLEVADPFACRNELGIQVPARQPVHQLEDLLPALPGDDQVHRWREILALGDETTEALEHRYQWFEHRPVDGSRAPVGAEGPAGTLRLARYFRERGQDPAAYAQVDDIWSIARHRAFLVRRATARAERSADDRLAAWVQEHGRPLVKRWGHIAPLLMQARLSLAAGREASDSVPRTLEDLAAREQAAAAAFPSGLDPASI